MRKMRRSLREKVVGGAAVAVLLGGGAFAAVSATGQGDGHSRTHARQPIGYVRAREISAAASYLGISTAVVARELRSGKSLAQLAAATAGKSQDGLVAALVAARQRRIAARVASPSVARAHAKRRAERLQKRMSALTERKLARSASS
jgi:hypothetical protein